MAGIYKAHGVTICGDVCVFLFNPSGNRSPMKDGYTSALWFLLGWIVLCTLLPALIVALVDLTHLF